MNKKIVYINSITIAVLALIATLSGLFWKGLYKNDTVSVAAQAMGQDLVTLIICIPVLLISAYLISKDSLRGQLIWMGTIFYFLYSYTSMSFLASYNQLFLVYVALFSLSLYTFIYGIMSLDVKTIKNSFSPGVTIKIAGVFMWAMVAIIAFMWLSMMMESLLSGITPASLENYTTFVIQALDLGVLVPAGIIAGLLLLKGRPWGYALISILIVKVSLLGMAILSMICFELQSGVIISWGQAAFFVIITLGGIIIALAFYSKINIIVKDSDILIQNVNLEGK